MPIADRNLAVGTQLVGSYKKETFTCVVAQGEGEALAYVLGDGRRFTSPSAAASAITNSSQNGWRWWSLSSDAKPARKAKASTTSDEQKEKAPRARKPASILKRMKSQEGAPDGQARIFCSACMSDFFAPAGAMPTACPQGHGDQPVE
jgi:hypothetical protein